MNTENTTTKKAASRDGFGTGLVAAARENLAVVGLCADLTESTKMSAFASAFPERFIQVGVAEQNLAGMAAGCALAGKIPFAASYACFHPANSWGVIRTSICYSNLNVKIVGGHAGIVTAQDGATHQSLEDIATMRVLPNMTVVVPSDAAEAHAATVALARHKGPAYLRTSKLPVGLTSRPELPFSIGKAIELRPGSDSTIIACGTFVQTALAIADHLAERGHSMRVINMHTIKPLDAAAVVAAATQTHAIFTLEDHQVIGGLGSAVAEVLAEQSSALSNLRVFRRFGMQDSFGQSGSPEDLLAHYELTASYLAPKMLELMQ